MVTNWGEQLPAEIDRLVDSGNRRK